jgi:hypothetical protein
MWLPRRTGNSVWIALQQLGGVMHGLCREEHLPHRRLVEGAVQRNQERRG